MKIPKPYIYLEIGRRLTHGHDVGWEGEWSGVTTLVNYLRQIKYICKTCDCFPREQQQQQLHHQPANRGR